MLSRKADERIVIGDDIVITIVNIRGDKVRIGIDAPKDVAVDRQEVARKKAIADSNSSTRFESN